MSARLTNLQRRFVEELMLNPLDASAAYIRAGGAKKHAKQTAYHLMKRPQVQELLAQKREKRAAKLEVKQVDVLDDLEGFRRLSVHDFFKEDPIDHAPRLRPLSEIQGHAAKFIRKIKTKRTTYTREDGREITTVEEEIELHSILKVEEMIGRHLGIWKDQLHVHLHRSEDLIGKSDEQLEKELQELKDADVTAVRDEPKRIGGK